MNLPKLHISICALALSGMLLAQPAKVTLGEISATAELSGIPKTWFAQLSLGDDVFGEPAKNTGFRVLRAEVSGENAEATGALRAWLVACKSNDLTCYGDSDKDGLPNLVEFACGATSPVVYDGNIVSIYPHITTLGKKVIDINMDLQFQVASPAKEGVRYIVEVGDGKKFRAGVLGVDYYLVNQFDMGAAGTIKIMRNLHKMATEPALAFIRLRVVMNTK